MPQDYRPEISGVQAAEKRMDY